jgi:hypothetical protein
MDPFENLVKRMDPFSGKFIYMHIKKYTELDSISIYYDFSPPPPFICIHKKNEPSPSYQVKIPYLKCEMSSSCYLLFTYNGHFEDLVKNLIWIYCTEKSVNGFFLST